MLLCTDIKVRREWREWREIMRYREREVASFYIKPNIALFQLMRSLGFPLFLQIFHVHCLYASPGSLYR